MKKYFFVIISSKVSSHMHIGTVRVYTATCKRQLMETRFVQVLESWICYEIGIEHFQGPGKVWEYEKFRDFSFHDLYVHA